MKFARTLSLYLARHYLHNLLLMMGVLLAVIYLFDTVELLRRAAKFEEVTLYLVLQMGLLKLPEVGQIALPFAVLFAAMFTFWQLTRRHELAVLRAAGFSAWQFLAPIIAVAVLCGVLQFSAVSPAGALMVARFERLENEHLSRSTSQFAIFREGLWLRQMLDGGHVILRAGRVNTQNWRLSDVTAFYFSDDDSFVQRIDAPAAVLQDGHWLFMDGVLNRPRETAQPAAQIALKTDLTGREIEESFASPTALSFWAMPGYIRTLESTGFDATRLRVHFHGLLAQPLMFAAMILLAAAVSLRPPRQAGGVKLLAAGVAAGFVVFFLSSFLQALGGSQQIPVWLAAWAPALVTFLLGLAALLSLEDG